MRLLGIGVISLIVACGGPGSGETAAPAESTSTGAPVAVPEPPRPTGPRAEQESYVLEATADPSGYSAGRASSIGLRLSPRNGWHVNMDFPVEVELSGPSELGYAKTRLAKPDAAEFDEQHFRFDVALTPTAAGPRTAVALVRFAVCTDENCLPQEAAVSLPIEVR